jgi:hypothetical protein
MPATPFFPELRARLSAMGARTTQALRQLDLPALGDKLRDCLPPHLLSPTDEGPGSRERVYSLGLTLQCFVWQMLKPGTSCREVVRSVQALFQANGWCEVKEGNSAYIQARQGLPKDRLEQARSSRRSWPSG